MPMAIEDGHASDDESEGSSRDEAENDAEDKLEDDNEHGSDEGGYKHEEIEKILATVFRDSLSSCHLSILPNM